MRTVAYVLGNNPITNAAIISKAEVTVPTFLRVYADDGSGGPNLNDAITGYGATGFDVWGKVLDPGHEWLVYEGSLNTEVTLSDAMKVREEEVDVHYYMW